MRNDGLFVLDFDGGAVKAVPLSQWRPGGESGSTAATPTGIYRSVSWVYRCVNLRADAIAGLPYELVRKGRARRKVDEALLAARLPDLLKRTEQSLCLHAGAYIFREQNKVKLLDLKWMAFHTITPETNGDNELVGFSRQVGARPVPLDLSDVVYVWLPDPDVEQGSGAAPAEVALAAAGIVAHANRFAADLFERGGMNLTILVLDPATSDADVKRAELWWRRAARGNRRAWEAIGMRRNVEVKQLGYEPDKLAMPDLKASARTEIASAFGVPETMIADAANFACLPGDQRVYTPRGPVPIAQLEPGDALWQYDPEAGLIQNTVTAILPQGPAPVYEIRTNKRVLRASENHPLLTVQVHPGRGPYDPRTHEFVWKRADALTEDDLLVITEELPDQGATAVDGLALSEEFMELCGLYTGDGCTRGGVELQFAIPEGPLQDYYVSTAERLFAYSSTVDNDGAAIQRDYNAARSFRCRREHYTFTVGSRDAARQFKRLGLTGDSRSKRVPEWVFGLSLPLRLAYLRGYLDSDGTVSKRGSLVFGSANLELVHQVRALCITCGIPVSNVLSDTGRTGNFGPIELHRFTCGYAEFNRLIGTHDPRYQERLAIERKGRRFGRWQPGAYALPNLALPSGVGLDRVLEVTEVGEEEVYDLSTLGSHTFIAEGIVVHNTASAHRLSFYEDTVLPEAKLIAAALNEQLLAELGLELVWHPEQLQVFQEANAMEVDGIVKLFAAGVISAEAARARAGFTEADAPKQGAGDRGQGTGQTETESRPQVADSGQSQSQGQDAGQQEVSSTSQADSQPPTTLSVHPSPLTPRPSPLRAEPVDDGADARRADIEDRAETRLATALAAQRHAVLTGGVSSPDDADRINEAAEALLAALVWTLERGAELGVTVGGEQLASLGIEFSASGVNEAALSWAREYAGELVTGINETTRSALREKIAAWIESGDALDGLVGELEPTFGASRARLIASTEVTRSFAQGNLKLWQGVETVTGKAWRTAADERVCPVCRPLAETKAKLDAPFEGGYDSPPAHPGCRCWMVPTVD